MQHGPTRLWGAFSHPSICNVMLFLALMPRPLYSLSTDSKMIEVNAREWSIQRNHNTDVLRCLILRDDSNFEFKWVPSNNNRIVQRYGVKNFALIHFDKQLSSSKVFKVLQEGIKIDDDLFAFLGCSTGGLKERKCFLWKGTAEDASRVISENGRFDLITSTSKRLARIGLLFSGCQRAVDVSEFKVDADVSRNGFLFTDGCGAMSFGLAKKIAESLQCPNVSKSPPSVFQIRYQGCKGVLMLDSSLAGESFKIRDSMKKFETTSFPYIAVNGYSRPFTMGFLNRQFIVLLSALGVNDQEFLQIQEECYQNAKNMLISPDAAVAALLAEGQFDLAMSEHPLACPKAIKMLRDIRHRQISSPERLRFLVQQSRNLYGVCDRTSLLNYGECFVRVTTLGLGFDESGHRNVEKMTLRGLVVVCKNPCYLLGDVRVLRAVDSTCREVVQRPGAVQKLRAMERDLADCIVFPVLGKRPHSNEIAGSDLDGDQFFVCWDHRLIPPKTVQPYKYPPSEVPVQVPPTRQSMLLFVAEQQVRSAVVGRIDCLYRRWADLSGADCQQCIRLGQLFAQAVDAAKTGGDAVNIPKDLIPPDPDLLFPSPVTSPAIYVPERNEGGGTCIDFPSAYAYSLTSPSFKRLWVWNQMVTLAEEEKAETQSRIVQELLSYDPGTQDCLGGGKNAIDQGAVSEAFVIDLLCSNSVRVGEFEIFLFATTWLQRQMDIGSTFQERHTQETGLKQQALDPGVDSPVPLKDSSARVLEPQLDDYCRLWALIVEKIDFGRFRIDQLQEATRIADSINSRGLFIHIINFRGIIMNALNKSKILLASNIGQFMLSHPDHRWRLWLRMEDQEFEWQCLVKAITSYKKSFIVLSLANDVSIGLCFLDRCKLGVNPLKNNFLVSFLFSNSFGYELLFRVGMEYTMNLDVSASSAILQIYRDVPGNSFMWLGEKHTSSAKGHTAVRPSTCLSVDLRRWKSDILSGKRPHPLINKMPIKVAEIFIINDDMEHNYFDTILSLDSMGDSSLIQSQCAKMDIWNSGLGDEKNIQQLIDYVLTPMNSEKRSVITMIRDSESSLLGALEKAVKEVDLKFFRDIVLTLNEHACPSNLRSVDVDNKIGMSLFSMLLDLKKLVGHELFFYDVVQSASISKTAVSAQFCEILSMIDSIVDLCTSSILKDLKLSLKLSAVLFSLRCLDAGSLLLKTLISTKDSTQVGISSEMFFNIIDDWESWSLIDYKCSVSVCTCLYTQAKIYLTQCTFRSKLDTSSSAYLLYLAALQLHSLMKELCNARENAEARTGAFKALQIDSIEPLISAHDSSDGVLLSFFAVDDCFDEESMLQVEAHGRRRPNLTSLADYIPSSFRPDSSQPHICQFNSQMRRPQSPHRSEPDLVVGSYVAVTFVADFNTPFNWLSRAGVGRVVRLCRAPRKIIVRLESSLQELPDTLIKQGKIASNLKCNWRLDPIGNVVQHQRAMHAIRSMRSSPLLPVLAHPSAFASSSVSPDILDDNPFSDEGHTHTSIQKLNQCSEESEVEISIRLGCSASVDVNSQIQTAKTIAHERLEAEQAQSSFSMKLHNDSQRQAVESSAAHRITLVQGPPGTGSSDYFTEVRAAVSDAAS